MMKKSDVLPSKLYTFSAPMAEKYGVDGAVMLQNIIFWVNHNRANGRNFYDGRYWTYNSINAFKLQFPFWTPRQIDRILKRLEEQGAIVTGSYNDNPWDHTKWFALSDSAGESGHQTVESISPNGEMYNSPNGEIRIHQTVKSSLTDINTDDYTDTPCAPQGAEAGLISSGRLTPKK